MAERTRFWRSSRWKEAIRPDDDLAQAEGLAAGTGLLTGQVARTVLVRRGLSPHPVCPNCGGESEIVVVDLVGGTTTNRCTSCSRRWSTQS